MRLDTLMRDVRGILLVRPCDCAECSPPVYTAPRPSTVNHDSGDEDVNR